MTITLHWWIVPILIVAIGIVLALILDRELREGDTGMMSGCFGITIIFLSIFLAVGVTIGHYL